MRVILLLIVAVFLAACESSTPERVLHIQGQTMGTTYQVSWVGQDAALVPHLEQQIEARLLAINKSMSTYDPNSELSHINRGLSSQDEQGWIQLSADLAEVLRISLDVWQQSDGAFEVTIGPLVNLWGFGPQAKPEITPSAEQIQHILAQIGSHSLQLDPQQRLLVAKQSYIDLSGVAKGWAVDELGLLLQQAGIHAYLIEIGGEIAAKGQKPNKQPWRIAIERPQYELNQRSALIVELQNQGVATSGDYRNFYEENGVRYSHTIDPKTGYPLQHNLASVTVIHPSTGLADAWATALMVLGPEKGMQLAEQYQLAVYMQIGENGHFSEQFSSAFKAQFPQVGGQ